MCFWCSCPTYWGSHFENYCYRYSHWKMCTPSNRERNLSLYLSGWLVTLSWLLHRPTIICIFFSSSWRSSPFPSLVFSQNTHKCLISQKLKIAHKLHLVPLKFPYSVICKKFRLILELACYVSAWCRVFRVNCAPVVPSWASSISPRAILPSWKSALIPNFYLCLLLHK